MLFLALFHVFKNMEQLSFDHPVETDVITRFPMTAKVFVPTSAGKKQYIYIIYLFIYLFIYLLFIYYFTYLLFTTFTANLIKVLDLLTLI